MYSRACIEIDLTALRANLARIRQRVSPARVLAVLKANAYGHGLIHIAKALEAADGLGVACVSEALLLRQAGCCRRIVVLEGCFSIEETQIAATHQLDIVVHHTLQLNWITQRALPNEVVVWVKVNTGMNRLGFLPAAVPSVWQALENCPWVKERVLMSHLASADLPDHAMTPMQLACFDALSASLSVSRAVQCSLANSAAIFAWPQVHYDWVRAGLALYGVSPFAFDTSDDHGLQPVMTVHSKIIAIQTLTQGDTVGYHGQWHCPESMRIGVVAFGYGDGFPYDAPNGTLLLVNGRPVELVGRVSMDILTVDLRSQPQACVGDPVILWGKGLPIENLARKSQRFPYELLCGMQRDLAGRLCILPV